MVDIPAHFLRKSERQFGAAGASWARELPSIVAACVARWQLSTCQPVDDLSINLVCTCTSAAHGEAVLKVQGPHSERLTEMTALELYGGRHACRCLACDRALGAMLLERLIPGDDLRSVPSRDEQLAIGAEMIAVLPISLSDSHGLPSYRDWMVNAFANMRRHYAPDAQMRALMDAAWELFPEVDDGSRYLLHGDLHHENILRAGEGRWKVIDPQGVIGPPVLECGRFVENHAIDEIGLDPEEATRTIAHVAARLGAPARRVAVAFFVLHLLATCWGYEMNYAREQLSRGQRECVEALTLVEACSQA